MLWYHPYHPELLHKGLLWLLKWGVLAALYLFLFVTCTFIAGFALYQVVRLAAWVSSYAGASWHVGPHYGDYTLIAAFVLMCVLEIRGFRNPA